MVDATKITVGTVEYQIPNQNLGRIHSLLSLATKDPEILMNRFDWIPCGDLRVSTDYEMPCGELIDIFIHVTEDRRVILRDVGATMDYIYQLNQYLFDKSYDSESLIALCRRKIISLNSDARMNISLKHNILTQNKHASSNQDLKSMIDDFAKYIAVFVKQFKEEYLDVKK